MININNEFEIVERLTAVEEREKINSHRLNTHEKEIKDISGILISIKEITLEIKYMRKDMFDVVERLKELESIPKNRWNELIKTIITIIVTALSTFILVKLGIK
ncbi:MAG: hypothetical protein GX265_00705 [Mollicutes bacterium]|nr:hypothetical protein [Mollicutes bacterium]